MRSEEKGHVDKQNIKLKISDPSIVEQFKRGAWRCVCMNWKYIAKRGSGIATLWFMDDSESLLHLDSEGYCQVTSTMAELRMNDAKKASGHIEKVLPILRNGVVGLQKVSVAF